ncbi:hypothetical protein DHB64_00790 [Antarcticibacterium sp. W02-3]|nr:hypothetical protein [Antarcticibacterium sp. W02-3]
MNGAGVKLKTNKFTWRTQVKKWFWIIKLVGRDSELHQELYKAVMPVFHLCLRTLSRGSFSCRDGREMCLGYVSTIWIWSSRVFTKPISE